MPLSCCSVLLMLQAYLDVSAQAKILEKHSVEGQLPSRREGSGVWNPILACRRAALKLSGACSTASQTVLSKNGALMLSMVPRANRIRGWSSAGRSVRRAACLCRPDNTSTWLVFRATPWPSCCALKRAGRIFIPEPITAHHCAYARPHTPLRVSSQCTLFVRQLGEWYSIQSQTRCSGGNTPS